MTKEEIKDHNRLWYIKTYKALINKGLSRTLEAGIYIEKHHILPKCMGGKNNKENFVKLTAREHIIAHMLLAKIYPDNIKLINAVHLMLSISKSGKRRKNREGDVRKISTRLVAKFRELAIKSRIGVKLSVETRKKMSKTHTDRISKESEEERKRKYTSKGHLGRKHTEETRQLLSKLSSGKKHSLDTREKMSKSRTGSKNPFYGKKFTKEHREKLSIAQKKRKVTEETKQKLRDWYKTHTCPHAKRVVGPFGEIYNSLKECAVSVGKSSSAVLLWIKHHPEKGYKYL